MAYVLDGLKFDARVANTLIEAKGPGYANFVKDGKFDNFFGGAAQIVKQARAQLTAARKAKLELEWKVAEPQAATAIKNLFKENGVEGIKVSTEAANGSLSPAASAAIAAGKGGLY
jgi:hypothetical protein